MTSLDGEERYPRYFISPGDDDELSYLHDLYQDAANIVLEHVDLDQGGSVLDMGYYACPTLSIIHEQLEKKNFKYFALEPNETVFERNSKVFENIDPTIFNTGVTSLAEVLPDGFPNHLDVAFCLGITGLLTSPQLTALLSRLSSVATYVVIGDDLQHLQAQEIGILRSPGDHSNVSRFLHPYERLLDEAGFDVESIVFPRRPTRYCTAFIVCRNRSAD